MSLSSCLDLINCIDGNNHPSIENRNLSSFTRVISRGSFEVRIIQGNTHEVEIEAESNLLQYIETRVSGNNLIIKTYRNRCLKNHRPILITITTPEIDRIELDGSGEITADNLISTEMDISLSGSGTIDLGITVEDLYVGVSGSGNIFLDGTADHTKMHISGSGDIKAEGLIQDDCIAHISGSGKMYIFVNDFLDASISGSGKIYYDGNPDVTSHISGSGKVIHL